MRKRRVGLLLVAALGLLLTAEGRAFASLPNTSDPSLSLNRTIRTTPFVGSSTSMRDHEGSTFVPSDNSLWLADDNANVIYEVDATTGALKRMIPRADFNSAPRFGGGPQAGVDRTDDFESMAYDQTNDRLYLFSGPCCTGSILPTAFRLTRINGVFQVESHQPLASSANYTASAWNPADGMIYVGVGSQLRTYNYETNTAGSTFQVPNLSAILGMGFSSDGADLFVVTNAEVLKRVDWASKTVVPGWTFDLLPFGVLDSRGVELIGDQLFVSDGADSRPAGPLKYAVFVFDVLAPAPTSAPSSDFDGDGRSDLLWRHATTGADLHVVHERHLDRVLGPDPDRARYRLEGLRHAGPERRCQGRHHLAPLEHGPGLRLADGRHHPFLLRSGVHPFGPGLEARRHRGLRRRRQG